MLQLPAISLPLHKRPYGLPIGIQLVGKLHRDEELIAAAEWLMETASGS